MIEIASASSWVLVLWFSTNGNYAYIPTAIEGFSTKADCDRAAEIFIREANRRPKALCLPKK